jgi:hypothetical protein
MAAYGNDSDSFIGLILLPIVGNAGKSTDLVPLPSSVPAADIAYRLPSSAEHVTSVW